MNTASASGADAGMSVNSKDYWEGRFVRDWVSNEGPAQSRFFTRLAVEHMPEWLRCAIRTEGLTICDWGCAQGDGTDLLRQLLKPSRTVGIDFARTAIEQARNAYTACEFRSDNILAGELVERFDILFSSNTLEHFHDPRDVLARISALASRFLVLLLPFREYDRIDEHFATFDFGNLPLALPGWNLVHSTVFDTTAERPCYWAGEQILLVYAADGEAARFALTLGQADFATAANAQKVLEQGLRSERRYLAKNAELRRDIKQRDRQIAVLRRHVELLQRGSLLVRLRSVVAGAAEVVLGAAGRAKGSLRKKRKKIKQRLREAFAALRPKVSAARARNDDESYRSAYASQSRYLGNYIARGLAPLDRSILRQKLLARIDSRDRVVIYPLSYPRELKQRPDHILRDFSENGFKCLIVSIDDRAPYVDEVSPGLFVTNLYAAVISHFADKKPVVYLTYPFFAYIIDHMPGCVVVYDVLDDLRVFSRYCGQMRRDHRSLLRRSDVTLFSSVALREANQDVNIKNGFLVTNGVWIDDFQRPKGVPDTPGLERAGNQFVIGYHGAISELIDWTLLEEILADKRVHLVLIGPLARFSAATPESADMMQSQARVLAHPRVTHVPPVAYANLRQYLSRFDAGIIPFIVSEKTDPVSPLKLFEYMAMGLPVFATPTRTLSEYRDSICVADRSELPRQIRQFIDHPADCGSRYDAILRCVDWSAQLLPVRSALGELLASGCPTRTQSGRVDIVNINFFDWDGRVLYKGGAERYIYDLACLFREQGWSVRILQNANFPFEVDFKGIPVVGIATGGGHDLRAMSKKLRAACLDADLVIASPLDLACELQGFNVIGINHGIYWDHKFKSWADANLREYKNLFDALDAVDRCVCVDTNFLNWVRTYDYDLTHKLEYIPNYFDGSAFRPTDKDFSGRLRILYPRRLYEARGIFVTLEAFDHLLERHGDIELHLVGQASKEDGQVVSAFLAKHTGRVCWEELDMEEMHRAYATSHVVLIPTLHSEGTSLSCLEAMATNNAVIATNIGGLGNLVIDGFNGRLIEPNAEALGEALESLLDDRTSLGEMASRGLQMAPVFEKARWAARWREIIMECKARIPDGR